VDVVIHAITETAAAVVAHAARHVSRRGVIVITSPQESVSPDVMSLLEEREIAIHWLPLESVLGFLTKWRRQKTT
jgi:hypothetical protein